MRYPIADWPEDTFLLFYLCLFLVVGVVGQFSLWRYGSRVRPATRWIGGAIVAVLCALHLASDVAYDRTAEHWVGRAPPMATFADYGARQRDAEYQAYWGPARRTFPWNSKTTERLALLPYLFLGAFIALQVGFRDTDRPDPTESLS